MGAIVCLNCSETLCEIDASREKNPKSKVRPPKKCELEEEGEEVFYRCPFCGAKNIVIETRTPSGFPQLTVVACSIERP